MPLVTVCTQKLECVASAVPQQGHVTQSSSTTKPSFTSTAQGDLVPTGIIAPLPNELFCEIASFSDHKELLSLVLVDSTFRAASEAVLYRSLRLSLHDHSLVLCLRNLVMRPELALYVRSCYIGSSRKPVLLLRSFFILLSRAFHNMRNLVFLNLRICGPFPRFLRGCPFRLTTFLGACSCNEDLGLLLEEQSTLSVLELCSSSYARIAIGRQALLHLSSVFAPPLALASLVPGRPVKEVGVSLFHPTFVTEELTSIIARDVALSTVPVESLKIAASIEPLEVVEVLAALEAFPRELPSLTAFAFHPISGRITPELCKAFQVVLEKFKCLRRLSICSQDQTDVIFDPATTHALIQGWHSCCTTLMSVTLPAMMWVYENELGWSVVSRGNDLASKETVELER